LASTENNCKLPALRTYFLGFKISDMQSNEVLKMAEETGDILTIKDLSIYLKIPKSTLYKLVREGRIPSQKIGRHWRFRKRSIDNWLDEGKANTLDDRGDR
jgi:excisionase family DNA binding protein